jgi:hypothetical protein
VFKDLYRVALERLAATGTRSSSTFLRGDGAWATPTATTTSGTLFTQTATVTISNSNTEATLVGAGSGSATLSANYLTAGKTIRITARGIYSLDAVSAPSMQWRVRIGGISGTVLLDTTAQTPAAGPTNRAWELAGEFTCRTTGASGTVFAQGYTQRSASAVVVQNWDMENTATATVDTTASQQIVVSFQFGTADTDNTISCTNLSIEALN